MPPPSAPCRPGPAGFPVPWPLSAMGSIELRGPVKIWPYYLALVSTTLTHARHTHHTSGARWLAGPGVLRSGLGWARRQVEVFHIAPVPARSPSLLPAWRCSAAGLRPVCGRFGGTSRSASSVFPLGCRAVSGQSAPGSGGVCSADSVLGGSQVRALLCIPRCETCGALRVYTNFFGICQGKSDRLARKLFHAKA